MKGKYVQKLLTVIMCLIITFSLDLRVKGDEYEKAIVDINGLSINELQEYVDLGYLNYEKITKLYLDRIEAYNEEYNALITISDTAIEEARALDEEYEKSGRRSRIHGLPIIVKDNIDVKGLPTTNGTTALLDSYPNEDAPAVKKLRDAGAIVIAKANMDEFAFNAAYSHSSFGYVYNAFDTDYSSYGSSGGSAVSVAANLAVLALGSDTGSSIRVPASANGIVGLRPTFGLIDAKGVIKFDDTRDTIGIMTKYVEDSAIVLEIIDEADIEYETYLTDSLEDVNIAVIDSYMNPNTSSTATDTGKTDRFVYELMLDAISDLEMLGANIIHLDSFELNYEFDATGLCYNFNEYLKGTNSKIRSLDDLIKNGGYSQYIEGYNNSACAYDFHDTATYKAYDQNRQNNIALANSYFEANDLDAIIYPTIKTKLMTIDETRYNKIYTPSSSTAPLIGFPAISVPMGYHDDLPYGLEIMAKANEEGTLYKIASAFESINDLYKTPSIAPSLYDVSTSGEELKDTYLFYLKHPIVTDLNEEVSAYFETNGSASMSLEYLNEYDQTIKEFYSEALKITQKEKNKMIFLYGIAFILIVVIASLIALYRLKFKKAYRS